MLLEVETIFALLVSSVWPGAAGVDCPAGMRLVEELGCLALHSEEWERMEWEDCREFCRETYLAHLGK